MIALHLECTLSDLARAGELGPAIEELARIEHFTAQELLDCMSSEKIAVLVERDAERNPAVEEL